MRPVLLLALAASLMVSPAVAQVASGPAPTAPGLQGASLPPLLDREVFFGDPEYASAQLSPDGQFVAFRRPHNGVMNVWVKGVNEAFEAARPLTADARPVVGYFWSRDGRYVLYVQDRDGDENFHVYAVDPSAPADAATAVPPARDLTPVEGIRAFIHDVPRNAPDVLLVGLNDRDPAWHDLYRVSIQTGERELVLENTRQLTGVVTDPDGEIHFATRTADDGSTELLRVDDDASGEEALGEVVYSCSVIEACGPVRLHPDGRVYLVTNRGERDLIELVLLDPETGEETLVERDPEGEVDFEEAVFSDVTDELLLTAYEGDRLRLYPKVDWMEDALATLREQVPDGELGLTSTTADEQRWTVAVVRDVDPGAVYLFDRAAGTTTLLYRGRPNVPTEHMAEMRPVRYRARDGREIPAYLALPKGASGRNLPTVLFPHGGPWARDFWGYDGWVQFFANRGYAVLLPNFRGSTGYGKAFLNAGNLGWGTGAMQHDLSDAVGYLVSEGIADPARVGIFGVSYGGYATLAGLAFTPELYAAGVSFVGPSNMLTLLETIPPYWASIRQMFYERMGNPETPEGRAQLEAQSPLNSADRIADPLLVIQGANDPRVKQAESDQIVTALRDRGFPVRYLVAPDEGHGFRDELNNLATFAAVEAFLAEHLGGRFQPDVRPEIQARLDALTVDPASVTLAAPIEEAPAGTFDASRLRPGTLRYEIVMGMMGQALTLDGTRTLQETEEQGRPLWLLVDAATGIPGMGTITDSTLLDRDTFMPVRRTARQGPGTILLRFTDADVTGEMQAMGQTMPINGALEVPVAATESSLASGLGALPLAEGYRATFAAFNPQAQRPTQYTIEVTGTETVTVPAGTFETWVVRLTEGDGTEGESGTLHVARETGVLVRSEMRLPPEAGGGTVTSMLKAME